MPSSEPSQGLVVRFSAAPSAVFLAGTPPPPPTFSEEALEAAKREAYARGAAEATHLIESQMLELREEAVRLQTETFAALAAQHAAIAEQFRALLPELVVETAARVLAATPIDRETVLRVVGEMLRGLEDEDGAVEVRLAAHDLELIAGHDAGFREKHPEISFRADADLRPGDCVVRSRFGTLDGRVATKLEAVAEALR